MGWFDFSPRSARTDECYVDAMMNASLCYSNHGIPIKRISADESILNLIADLGSERGFLSGCR